MYRVKFLVIISGTLLLAACSNFSLAGDITPPPGAEISSAIQPTQSAPTGALYPLVPPDPAQGEPIFIEKCSPCHGQNGLGDGPQASQLPNPPPPLGSATLARQSTPVDWYTTITTGNLERFMPPFNSLSERQRWDVVAYLYSLSTSPDMVSQGKELYQANCAHCHGVTGQGNGPDAAGLETALIDFSDQSTMVKKSSNDLYQAISEGLPPSMPAFADQMTSDQRWALTDYLRSLTFASSKAAVSAGETPGLEPTPQTETTSQGGITATPAVTETIPEVGSVTGKVVNSSGGEVPPDLTVTLHGFDDMQETYTISTSLQSDSTYSFQNVDLPVGRVFIASTEYDQTTYNSDISIIEAGTNSIDLTIPIYETTTDTTVLSVDRLHIFFDYVEPDTLQVVELYIISNLSDYTYIASQVGAPTITIDLPEGATNLQFEDGSLGGRYIETASGFGDTSPVIPGSGQHQIVFAYEMPYQRKLDIVQPLTLPVNAVVILVPEDGLNIKSDQFKDEGTRDVQGMTYHMYSGEMLDAGTNLSIQVSGRPSAASSLVTGSRTGLVIGLAAFGLALIVAGIWLYRRNQLRYQAEPQTVSTMVESALFADRISSDPDNIIDAIIALDDRHQSGDLPEGAYHQRRSELKARLKELLGDQEE